jgi:hypothetical protein
VSQEKRSSPPAPPKEGKKEERKAKTEKPKPQPQPSQKKPLPPQSVGKKGEEGRKKKEIKEKGGNKGETPSTSPLLNQEEQKLPEKVSLEKAMDMD